DERLRSALEQLYPYYRGTERMMENLHRDEATMPTIKRLFAAFRDYLSAARETLMSGRPAQVRAHERARAAIGHALAFATWRSLTRGQGLDDNQAAARMCRLAAAAPRDPDKPQ